MKFDPNEYETVKSRKERFYKDHKDGRIVVELLNTPNPLDYALFRCSIYLTAEDQEKGLSKSTGYALEVRDKELSVSNSGKEYESVNYSSWTENAEESAVGRALDNAGYSGNKKPSREEMQKADRMNKTMKKKNEKDLWCDYHKTKMRLNRNGNPYHLDKSRKEGDQFCNGMGFPSEAKEWKEKTKKDKSVSEQVADEIPFN